MALKPIGIEDNNTFPGRVGTALTSHAQAAVADALAGKSDSGHTHAYLDITGKPTTFPPDAHTHDDRYYTETEVNTALSNKVDKTSMVTLTQAEYDAIVTKDPAVYYFITA